MAWFKVLVLLCLVRVLYSAEYYVRADLSTTCPTPPGPTAQPCLTLNEYLQNSTTFFTAGSAFTLLQGEHHLNDTVTLSGVTGITFRGQDMESTTISIYAGGIMWNNSKNIEISSLRIYYQGGPMTSHTALTLVEVSSLQVLNVQFMGQNRGVAYSQGIKLVQSDAQFVNCSFTNWHSIDGGAVYADASNISFSGYSAFRNNEAEKSGGGIYISNNSRVSFTGTSIFEGNGAKTISENFEGGSGLFGLNSTISFNGTSNFTRNGPISENIRLSGGGIKVHSCTLTILSRASFTENSGNFAGALDGDLSDIILKGYITFSRNRFGGSVSVFRSNLTCSDKITFTNNEIIGYTRFGPAIYSKNSSLVLDGVVLFENNIVHEGVGGAISASNSHIRCQGNVTFVSNSAERGIGGAVLIDQSILESSDNISFIRNSAAYRGGAVYAINSIFNATGTSVFKANTAMEGGGMGLNGNSKLVLHSPVNLTFEHNRALSVGGCILFIDSDVISQCHNISVERKSCFFIIENETVSTSEIHLNFIQNYANKTGSVLYGGSLDFCRVEINGIQEKTDNFQFFQSLSSSNTDKEFKDSSIASEPFKICFCENSIPDCSESNIKTMNFVMGAQFVLQVTAVGQGNTPVPSIIRSYINDDTDNVTELDPETSAIGGECTNITFRLFTEDANKTLILFPDGKCGETEKTRQEILLILDPCPPGFSPNGVGCTCEERLLYLNKNIECNIDTLLIERPDNSWINPIWDENLSYLGFVYHPDCPPGYCKPKNENISFPFTPNISDVQCSSNRSGLLCGACREGYSLTLNNFNCMICDNRFISLLLYFAFAGVALLVVLLVLHMTVAAGTINGLILYANIVNINSIVFFPPNTTNILTVFIAWLNLDFGIETCLYDGLDFYSYAWLQFAFPFYMWFLIGVIIIINKKSTKFGKLLGSNPVAVLATIILMSFTKLLQVTIVILSRTFLECPDGSRKGVWLYDANIGYFEGKHIALSIMALCVIFLLLVPYIILLLFGYHLQAYSGKRGFFWLNKFKPLLDAYYAPYHMKMRYWPGFMILVRGCLNVTCSVTALSNTSANLVSISSVFTAIALIPWLSHHIYEKFYNEILEASFILNICLLSTASYHVISVDGKQEIVTDISISIAFVQFLGIVCFHLYLSIKAVKAKIKFYEHKKKPKTSKKELPVVTITLVDLREPLLED